jgi:hypothetical protein
MALIKCSDCGNEIPVYPHATLENVLRVGDHFEYDYEGQKKVCVASGECVKIELPDYVRALFLDLWKRLEEAFKRRSHRDFCEYSYNLEIEGLAVRRYYEEDPEPNFVFGGACLWWYKRPGRSMETNVDWSPDQWVKWFDACTLKLKDWEIIKWTERR